MQCKHLLILSTTLLALTSFSVSSASLGVTQSLPPNPRDVIDDYRILRSACAQMEGAARRGCFARLNQQTKQYQNAKERIKSAQMLGLRLTSR